MNPKQQQRMLDMLKTFEGSAVQPDELAKVVKVLLEVMKTLKGQLEQQVKDTSATLQKDIRSLLTDIRQLEDKTNNAIGEVSNKSQQFSLAEVSKIAKQLQKEMDTMRGEMPEMPDLSVLEDKIQELRNKKNLTMDEVMMKMPKDHMAEMEAMMKEMEEMKKKMVELEKRPMGRNLIGGAGGLMRGATRYHKLTPDGSTKIFDVPKSTTSIIFMSDFPHVLFENNGFTLNAQRAQVTLTVANAPSTDSQLVYSYSPMFGT